MTCHVRFLYRPARAAAFVLVTILSLAARAQGPTPPPPDAPPSVPSPDTRAAPPVAPLTDTPAPPPIAAPTPPPPVSPQPAGPPVEEVAAPAPAAPAAPAAEAAGGPLAGVSDGIMLLRSPDDGFVFMPAGRLQVDGYAFASDNKHPNDGFLLKRARLELNGWIGGWVFFTLQGDFATNPVTATAPAMPASPANLATTDDFVALAPFGDIATLQVGQFDAPFMLENRTSDEYFDFIERSITVRAFGIPSNKEQGAMVNGFNDARNFLYSVGVFNGDGQNFRNVDEKFDVMGRAWIAPLSFAGDGPLKEATLGGSFWTGDRNNTLPPANQQTMGGYTFLSFAPFTAMGASTPQQFRQLGRHKSFAGELSVPIEHRYGLRSELVWRKSPLALENIAVNGTGTIASGAELSGWASYSEVWFWIFGDDRIIGDQQGLGAFPRFKKFGVKPVQDGLMVAFRFEFLDEELTEALPSSSSAVGQTKVTSYQLGLNYWHSKRFRATFNYALNHFTGTTGQIRALASPNVQEFLLRLAVAL